MLRDIVGLLRGAGVEFGYLYEDEFYAGALLYDDGLDDAFGEHARRVAAHLKKLGVRRLITVDPHTTNMLRQAYPRFVKDYDIEVQNYLEVLAETHPEATEPVNGEVVVHDSCVYARYENIREQPRELLRAAGLSVREAETIRQVNPLLRWTAGVAFPGRGASNFRKSRGATRSRGEERGHHVPVLLGEPQQGRRGQACRQRHRQHPGRQPSAGIVEQLAEVL